MYVIVYYIVMSMIISKFLGIIRKNKTNFLINSVKQNINNNEKILDYGFCNDTIKNYYSFFISFFIYAFFRSYGRTTKFEDVVILLMILLFVCFLLFLNYIINVKFMEIIVLTDKSVILTSKKAKNNSFIKEKINFTDIHSIKYRHFWGVSIILNNKSEIIIDDFKNLEKIYQLINDKYSIYSLHAMSLHKTGESNIAKEMLSQLISNPKTENKIKILSYIQMAHICAETHDFEKAYENIAKALEFPFNDINLPYIFSIFSLLFLEEKNNKFAKITFRIKKLLNKKLNYKSILYIARQMNTIAESINKPCFYSVAIIFYKQLLKKKRRKSTNIEEILYSLSRANYEMKKYKNSLRYLQILIKSSKNGDKTKFYHLLACAYYKEEKYKEAIDLFEMLLQDERICLGTIYYNLAYCYFDDEQYEKAEKAIEKAISENDLEEESIINLKELQENIKLNKKNI